ncbi:MAG: dihydroneopterin aldolase [Candidatus Neomarinimicrobiota bacterium]|nr:MAG: dihydroneopterin aldolase [Candidatus Neomarinimicrobiota bacterium]
MGTISLKNMVFYGYHGVAEQEKILGGRFEVDLSLDFDMTAAIASDHLSDTISYEDLYKLVHDVVTKSKFYLIEALAGKIISVVFKKYHPEKVMIRIRKPGAPVRGVLDTVEVCLERTREQMEGSD